MAMLGLIGGPLICASGILVLFDVIDAGSPVQVIATIPEFIWELSLGIYLIVKGFKPCPILTDEGPQIGVRVPEALSFVPIDFEAGESWWEGLGVAGFEFDRPAVAASTGVTMYLSKDTTAATLRQLAALAPGSTVAMTFLLPIDLLDERDRAGLDASAEGARQSGTPFASFFRPDEIVAMARDAGFAAVQHIPGSSLGDRYFANRADGLRPSSGEDFVVATT